MEFAEHIRADFERGELHWKAPTTNQLRLTGTLCGGIRRTKDGKWYWCFKFQGSSYKRSRVIFYMRYGRWPVPCVDHINGDSLDDRIDNLREATFAQNSWNHKSHKRSKELPMGVRHMGNKYQARICYQGRLVHMGTFPTVEEAHRVYLEKRKELFREFA